MSAENETDDFDMTPSSLPNRKNWSKTGRINLDPGEHMVETITAANLAVGDHGLLDDYMNIRSLPAMLSVVFVVAGLYQFGGLAELEITWLSGSSSAGNYLLTTHHAMIGSLGAFLVAFMSSQTKRFENYEQ